MYHSEELAEKTAEMEEMGTLGSRTKLLHQIINQWIKERGYKNLPAKVDKYTADDQGEKPWGYSAHLYEVAWTLKERKRFTVIYFNLA